MNASPSHDTYGSSNSLVTPPPVPPGCVYTRCYCEENIYLLADALVRHPDVASTQDPRTPSLWDPYVVFISNHQRSAALWHQKAREGVVVWDYHVVLVLRPRGLGECASRGGETAAAGPPCCWVYDWDSRCALPCTGRDYMGETFPYTCEDGWEVPARYVSLFRVVPAEEYLDNFVSDRSHMLAQGREDAGALGAEAAYAAPPPPYPPLRGRRATDGRLQTNLMSSFVAMGPAPELQAEHVGGEGAPGARAADIKEARTYGEVLGMSDFLAWLSVRT